MMILDMPVGMVVFLVSWQLFVLASLALCIEHKNSTDNCPSNQERE